VLEDNAALRQRILLPALRMHGFLVQGAASTAELYRHMLARTFDIAVLGIGFGGDDVLAVTEQLRAMSDMGIVVLTGDKDRQHHTHALRAGADVCLAKPIDVQVLSATLQSLGRRLVPRATRDAIKNETAIAGSWQLETGGWRLISPLGKPVQLTSAEQCVVMLLAQEKGQPVPRDVLIRALSRHAEEFDPTMSPSEVPSLGSSAYGAESWAQGNQSTALGFNAWAVNDNATAVGANAWVQADNSVALGYGSLADRANTVSVGAAHDWQGLDGTVFPATNRQITNVAAGTEGTDAVNVDQLHAAIDGAVGDGSTNRYFKAEGMNDGSDDAAASGAYAVASGAKAKALGDDSVALGASSTADGALSVALGRGALASGTNSMALGAESVSSAVNSVALGNGSIADRRDAVSVGKFGAERQIINVADGVADTDAVNVRQLKQVGLVDGDGTIVSAVTYDDSNSQSKVTFGKTWQGGTTLSNIAAGVDKGDAVNVAQYESLLGTIGGGAALVNGMITAPQFNIMGGTYNTVGGAFDAVNDQLGKLDNRVGKLEANPGSGSGVPIGTGDGLPVGSGSHADGTNDVAVGTGSTVSAENGTAVGQGSSVTASNAVALGAGSVADQDNTVSVGNADQQRRVTNMADGVAATDAATVGQVTQFTQNAINAAQSYADAGDAQTLNAANAYTDQKVSNLVTNDNFNAFKDSVNQQFHSVNKRISRVGAMGAAMAGMAGAIAAAPGTDNRVSAAAGTYGGENALSVGFSRRLPGNGALLIGGSVAGGGESSGTVGVSFGW
jgi:autotransporter adhesin/DNA-binding response OmpR family regulator